MPMDVEVDALELQLLQARPITTLYSGDPGIMTQPGEKHLLYFDSNVVTEATTTTPFTIMALDCMNTF